MKTVDQSFWGEFEEETSLLEKEHLQANRNSLDIYLCDVKNYQRLSPQREALLGKRVRCGLIMIRKMIENAASWSDDLAALRDDIQEWLDLNTRPKYCEVHALKMISERIQSHDDDLSEERMLFNRRIRRVIQKVQQAVDEMVTSNLGLVVKVAKDYLNRGLDLADLIQEGNLGLIKAVGKFDYSMGNRLSTYAVWWIRQSIIRSIYDKSRTIRMPAHLVEMRNSYYRSYHKLLKEQGREPDMAEVSLDAGLDYEQLVFLFSVSEEPTPLDEPKGEGDLTWADTISSEEDAGPFNIAYMTEVKSLTRKAIAELPFREEKIIEGRFGIGMENALTLKSLSGKFKISRERVRQIQDMALNRLAQMDKLKELLAPY